MSDVSQPSAPPPSAPSTTPPPSEVPVNEAPVSQPSPLGDQAPPKPPGQESNKSSHLSRREAIQNAFAKAKEAQAEAEKNAAEKPKVAAKPQEKAPQPERHREQGRFARDPSKPQPEQQQPQGVQQQPPAAPQQYKPLDQNAPFREAPQRFDERARSEWQGTPESVRGAVDRMTREFQGAYERYRGDHEAMNQIRPFHDLATRQGTSLARAFENYYGMEVKLRQDVIGGLDVIVNNLKLRAADGSPITLRDVAAHILNMSPEQHQMTAQKNQQTSADMRIGQLHQMVEQLTQGIGQMQYQQKFSQTRAQVDQFAEQHPRFDELADLIKAELDHGYPLDVAYRRADMLRPRPQAAQTRNAPAQTRKTSISGAPDGGTRPSDGRRSARNGEAKHPTRREAIAKAIRRVSNGV